MAGYFADFAYLRIDRDMDLPILCLIAHNTIGELLS